MLVHRLQKVALGAALLVVAACGDAKEGDGMPSGEGNPGDAQEPPTEAAALEAWLETGAYQDWQCEPEVHASRSPSPHGFNRICSNDAISARVEGDSDWPSGAAAVKELYESVDATTPLGYAVYLKTASDSAGGAAWYWYERVGDNVVADGLGDSGPPKAICVSCHVAAGSDAAHTPTPGGRDQVYTPVP